MKAQHLVFGAACLGVFSVFNGGSSLAQNGLQSEIVNTLRPVPMALQSGHRGLPQVGSATPTYSQREIVSARPSVAPVRTAHQTPQRQRSSAAATRPAVPAGCTTDTPATDKPMIGFKIAFEFGSAQLKPESLETLRELGKALNEGLADQKQFEIEGHTDAVGTYAYNEQLSKQRAEAVKYFLVREMGVAEERLTTVGKGFCELAVANKPDAAENRRVVIVNQLR